MFTYSSASVVALNSIISHCIDAPGFITSHMSVYLVFDSSLGHEMEIFLNKSLCIFTIISLG